MTRKQIANYLILLSSISKGKKISVVLAEDDIDDQILFEEAIVEANIPVDLKVLGDGEKLMLYLETLKGSVPDVIFLDLNMPCINGFECLDLIRKNERLKDIPIIIFSTSVNKTDILNTYNKGANLYFPKPYSFQQLVESLKQLFRMEKDEINQRRGIESFLFQYK
jgi:CheY-like chemotaxis protein